MTREQRLEAEEARAEIERACKAISKGDDPKAVAAYIWGVARAAQPPSPDQLPDPGLTREETEALIDWTVGKRQSGHGLRVGVLLDRAVRKLRAALSLHDSEGDST